MKCTEQRPCLVEVLFYEATGKLPDCDKCPMRKEVVPDEVHTSRLPEADDR